MRVPSAGYAAPSFGVHCAAMAGMRPDILERTKEVLFPYQSKHFLTFNDSVT